jgi:hypothetical protein
MIQQLIHFEWLPFRKKWSFYAMLLVFLLLGIAVTSNANFPMREVYKNAPFTINLIVAMFCQVNILSVTILAAQVLLREQDASFQQILYATPLNKNAWMISRVIIIFLLSSLLFLFLLIGFGLGHLMIATKKEALGPFNIWYYLQPYLLFGLPGILFCIALVCSVGWFSKNKLMIYMAGLFVYILYVMAAIFSNSPLLAKASPVSDAAMSLSAKLDPFGASAFFEQTKNWSVLQRNSSLLTLSGNMLFNRLLWLVFSVSILICCFRFFKFSLAPKKEKRKADSSKDVFIKKSVDYAPPLPDTKKHRLQTIGSFVRLDLKSMVKGIPFKLMLLIWIFLLGMEIYSDLDAGIRLPQRYAGTTLMVNNIIQTIPFFCLMCIVFFSNEIIWRSKNAGIDSLENSSPANTSVVFISKLISLSAIPILLVTVSIVTGIVFQLSNQYPHIDIVRYLSLYYFIALPMFCSLVIIMSIQAMLKNKYIGITAAAAFVLLCYTSIGNIFGLNHPLFQPGKAFSERLSEIAGSSAYKWSFGWNMMYAGAIAILFASVASATWNRISSRKMNYRFNKPIAGVALLVALFAGGYIFYQENVLQKNKDQKYRDHWQFEYEKKYRPYTSMSQPMIIAVTTTIDLFPDKNSYKIKGTYTLQNQTNQPIDSFLIYSDKAIHLDSMIVNNASLIKKDEEFGHYLYRLKKPLAVADSFNIDFSCSYQWSPFAALQSFNAIVDNGAFIRISNYYPLLGYQAGNELEDEKKRTGYKLPANTARLSLQDSSSGNKDFIRLDILVSTSSNQTAIAVGELQKQWTSKGRNYFHYKTSRTVPFRFAVSSAEYAVKKSVYKGRSFEVFYHPAHPENVDRLMETAKKTINYCEENFGPYPFQSVRFAEVSSFTSGFAATAYPATIFMTEHMVFHSKLNTRYGSDVINELSAHELSHQWWGGAPLYPADKVGSRLLTETLAMYTEMMMNKKESNEQSVIDMVKMHRGLYFSDRSMTIEKPLFIQEPQHVYLAYSKGLICMYQLYLLIGEKKINHVLKQVLQQHAYPLKAASSLDFLQQLYTVCTPGQIEKIDALFKHIITHEAAIEKVSSKNISINQHLISLEATVLQFNEDGKGGRTAIPFTDSVDIAIYTEGKKEFYRVPVVNNKINASLYLSSKPVKAELDPFVKLMEANVEDNVKQLK